VKRREAGVRFLRKLFRAICVTARQSEVALASDSPDPIDEIVRISNRLLGIADDRQSIEDRQVVARSEQQPIELPLIVCPTARAKFARLQCDR